MDDPNIVLLIFSKSERPDESWSDLQSHLIAQLSLQATGCDHSSPIKSRYLDQPPSSKLGRVLEVRTTIHSASGVPKPFSLRECKAFTDGAWFSGFASQHNIELILQPYPLYAAHRHPGLAVFDMDSTLIQQEVIDELARAVGLYAQVSAITDAAMRGEAPYTDFEASLRARVALLDGVPVAIWEELKRGVITFTPGAVELARGLRALGWKTAVISGGFTVLAEWVRERLGLDYVFANQLVEDRGSGRLTGELVPGAPIVHGLKKRELLLQLASENGIPRERVVAVGDGSNDLPMMDAAGLGIAFNAKPKVQLAAPTKLNGGSLLDVLYVLGYTKEEIDHAVGSP